MKLIGKPQDFHPSGHYIEDFHRVALGLETGTQVYLCKLPKPDPEIESTEIILSTFDPEKWPHLWRLELVLAEREGVVAEALHLLQERNINIGILETLTTESSRSHELLAIVEFPRGISGKKLSKDLKERLGTTLRRSPVISRMSRLFEVAKARKQYAAEDTCIGSA